MAITLRHLVTGDNYKSLMYLFYVPHNTISILVQDVCQAIWDENGDGVVSNPTTAEGWKEIAASYSGQCTFHHALGALDGKHIRIWCPAIGGSQFSNYKGYHSIVLLALVDANYRLKWSKMEPQEQQLMPSCGMSPHCETQIDIPQQEPLQGEDRSIPYFIIQDNVFALNEWMMKPFAAAHLEQNERFFNYHLTRARRCVENAFGILANC